MKYPKSKSFNKGLNKVPHGKYNEVKAKLKSALGISSGFGFRNRRDGKVNHTISDCQKIESVFAEYGVTDPWGE